MPIPLLVAGIGAAIPLIYNELSKDDEDPNRVGERSVNDVAKGLGIEAPSNTDALRSEQRADQARSGADGGWTGDVDLTQSDQSRAEQVQALGLTRDAAMGNGPSAAGLTMQRGLDDSMLANRALAASARGGGVNSAAAMRAALVNNSRAGVTGAQMAGELRANEMNAARGQYLGGAQGLRGSDWAQASGVSSLRGQAQGMRDNRELSFAALARQQKQDAYNNAMGLSGMDTARRSGNAAALAEQRDRQNKADAAALNSAATMGVTGYQLAKAGENAPKAPGAAAPPGGGGGLPGGGGGTPSSSLGYGGESPGTVPMTYGTNTDGRGW